MPGECCSVGRMIAALSGSGADVGLHCLQFTLFVVFCCLLYLQCLYYAPSNNYGSLCMCRLITLLPVCLPVSQMVRYEYFYDAQLRTR